MILMKKKVISAINDLETAIRKIDQEQNQFANYENYVKIKAIKEELECLSNKLSEMI